MTIMTLFSSIMAVFVIIAIHVYLVDTICTFGGGPNFGRNGIVTICLAVHGLQISVRICEIELRSLMSAKYSGNKVND